MQCCVRCVCCPCVEEHMTHWRSAECHVTSNWPHLPPHRWLVGGGEGEQKDILFTHSSTPTSP